MPASLPGPTKTIETSVGPMTVRSIGCAQLAIDGCLQGSIQYIRHDREVFLLDSATLLTATIVNADGPQVTIKNFQMKLVWCQEGDEHFIRESDPGWIRVFRNQLHHELEEAFTKLAQSDPLFLQEGTVAFFENQLLFAKHLRDETARRLAPSREPT